MRRKSQPSEAGILLSTISLHSAIATGYVPYNAHRSAEPPATNAHIQRQMNGHSPTIPFLDSNDLRPWVLAIKFEAGALGVTQEVKNPNYTAPLSDKLGLNHSKVCALMRAILGSLSRRLKSQVVSCTQLANPYLAISAVKYIIQQSVQTERRSLKLRAENVTFQEYANLKKYLVLNIYTNLSQFYFTYPGYVAI